MSRSKLQKQYYVKAPNLHNHVLAKAPTPQTPKSAKPQNFKSKNFKIQVSVETLIPEDSFAKVWKL